MYDIVVGTAIGALVLCYLTGIIYELSGNEDRFPPHWLGVVVMVTLGTVGVIGATAGFIEFWGVIFGG